MKYSRVHKYIYGRYVWRFRYNYTLNRLECVSKADAEWAELMREESSSKIAWLARKAGESLASIEATGYALVNTMELSTDCWKDDKFYYMDVMSEDMIGNCGW